MGVGVGLAEVVLETDGEGVEVVEGVAKAVGVGVWSILVLVSTLLDTSPAKIKITTPITIATIRAYHYTTNNIGGWVDIYTTRAWVKE